jgi:DNA primase
MKTILEFLPNHKKKGNNEYAGPCPWCGGTDRFVVWPSQGKGGRFLCRQCHKKGDVIDFLKAEGFSYKQAIIELGLESNSEVRHVGFVGNVETVDVGDSCSSKQSLGVSQQWINAATSFIQRSLEHVSADLADWQKTLLSKHIKMETALEFKIGWNPSDQYHPSQNWGIDGNKIRLPRGLVIPTGRDIGVVGIKIRCTDISTGPKYWQVKGSGSDCLYLGDEGLPVVIVESDLDAYLIFQEARTRVGVVSLGGTNKPLDQDALDFVRQSPKILIATDFDDQSGEEMGAGQKAFYRLKQQFPDAEYFPPAIGKDPCDMQTLGVTIKLWLDCGIGKKEKQQERRLAD